ncbi:MAG: type III PLP-dependent enzyme [Alphaproteobacteria bacterium]|nr:type III PLP-dependent enzyme [Alphaproteobacteria bacterium]
MNISAVRRVPATRGNVPSARANGAAMKARPGLEQFTDIDTAVAALRPAETLHCLHPDALAQNAALFLKHFPGKAHYAVKVNPDPYVLTNLYDAGIRHFDVASLGEVQQVRQMFPKASLAFMHPVKGREAIRAAYFDYGVRAFVLDSYDELVKIRQETNNAGDLMLVVRLDMPEGCAAVPLSGKFGATPELTVKLLQDVRKVAPKIGLSFHVGSQTPEPSPYVNALKMSGDVIRQAGVSLDVLDVGGGFPIPCLGMDVPPLTVFFDAIREGLNALSLPESCDVWSEPGAGLSGLSSTVVVRVELRKDDVLYLNDGNFGSLRDLCYEKRRNDVRMIRPRQKNGSVALKPFRFYGPACESMDYMPGPFMLPEDINEGDWIAVSGLGAYGQVFRTIYNGFYSDHRVEIQKRPSAKLMKFPKKK